MKNLWNNILSKYFNEQEVKDLLKSFENHQRFKIMNEKYFAKIGKNDHSLFFRNLQTELILYRDNKDNSNLPKLIDWYVDDEICFFVLQKIPGITIGNHRNDFRIHINKEKRLFVSNSILNIAKINIKDSLDDTYNRKERLERYLKQSRQYLSTSVYNKLICNKNSIISEKYNRVISHGDLISTNIIIHKDKVYFVDWEFVSYKPKYYDLIYFLLFSKTSHSIDLLDDLNISSDEVKEALKDGIIICLKEIQNHAKLYGKIDDMIINRNVNRWKKELNFILKKIESE